MVYTKPINKKRKARKKNYRNYRESRKPASQNPIYTKEINGLKCHYHHSAGRKRIFKNLWCLYMHYTLEHDNENYKEFTMNLADLIIKKVLI